MNVCCEKEQELGEAGVLETEQLIRDTASSGLQPPQKLQGIEHFAMPTKNMAVLERFVREVFGGIPYYYAGYDEIDRQMGRKPHIFMRIGEILFQCTEEGGPMHPTKDDMSVSPHWAFAIAPEGLQDFIRTLRDNGVPYVGPFAQPQHGVTSIYFESPEGLKLEVCAAGPAGNPPVMAENEIDWKSLNHDWRPRNPVGDLSNIHPVPGGRDADKDNRFGFSVMHHFTLPVKDIVLMERFLIDLLHAEKGATGPLRIGNTRFECTIDPNSPLYPVPRDNNISPHWSFGASTATLDFYISSLKRAGLKVAGPYRHRAIDLVSIYFKSPEGHKFEIATWEPYPKDKAAVMGAPGVGFIPWPDMDHNWRPRA
jgi:catechol 2,3-dioxygenase-like lactoylglutathione lyase family enzyme